MCFAFVSSFDVFFPSGRWLHFLVSPGNPPFFFV